MLNPASPSSVSCLDPTPENLCYPSKRGDYIYFETPPYQPGESPKVCFGCALCRPVALRAAWLID